MEFSDKQRYLALYGSRPAKDVIVTGPGQCGKSEAAIAGFMQHSLRVVTNGLFAVVTRSKPQMNSVVLPKIIEWCRRNNIRIALKDDHFFVDDYHGGVSKFLLIISGEGKESVQARLYGPTLDGIYADEIDKTSKPVLDILATRRFATAHSKMLGTMNPTHPNHHIKTELIDKLEDIGGEWIKFGLADNPVLDIESVMNTAKNMTPAMFKRMVLGEFAADSGLIYPIINVVAAPPAPVTRYEVGVDYARYGVTAAVLVAFHPGGWTVVDEFYDDASITGDIKDADKADKMFNQFIASAGSISSWAVPTDGGGIYDRLKDIAKGDVNRARDKVSPGIGILRSRFEGKRTGRLSVASDCRLLLGEAATYSWAKNPSERGESIPDKASAKGAHLLDALRYQAATHHVSMSGVEL